MTLHIGFLAFPGIQQLDMTGPYEIFASAPDTQVHIAAKTLDPIVSATGFVILPTVTLDEAPQFDVVCVPGGGGVNALLRDEPTLAFLRRQAAGARFVTSVCTGSLVLGAAGLLKDKRAACHWIARDFLPHFGAIPVAERVVRDGNVFTAGGVTSGIDFALVVVAELMGEAVARTIQLSLEYAPAPPFADGTPETSAPEIVAAARARMAKSRAERERLIAGA